MTKREVLIAICENPGWEPPQPVASSVDHALGVLQQEGWIRTRLDGWEPTGKAVTEYPDFLSGELLGIAGPQDDSIRGGASVGQTVSGVRRPTPDWSERVLPLMTLRNGQLMEALIEGSGVRGTVRIANTSQTVDLREVEITVRVRRVQ